MLGHFEFVGHDHVRVHLELYPKSYPLATVLLMFYLSVGNKVFTSSPSIKDSSAMDGMEGDALENDIIEIVVNMEGIPMQSDQDQLSSLIQIYEFTEFSLVND